MVRSFENEVYAALWSIGTNPAIRAEDFFSVATPQNIYQSSTVFVRTSSIPEEYRTTAYNGRRFIQIFAFDKSFKAYFNSRTSNSGINDPFTQGGNPIEWNVNGDNVIGMFIGTSVANPVLVE